MNTQQEQIAAFAALLEAEQLRGYEQRHGTNHPDLARDASKVSVKPGKLFTKVDVGSSGKYMVEHSTGIIYGIKAYGVVHRGHTFGTLDTIHDWHWSEYRAFKKQPTLSNASS